MRLDLVEKVVIGKLKPESESYDQRGRIATLHMKEIPNTAYAQSEGIAIIQFISALLYDRYESCLSQRGRGKAGEQSWSWIYGDFYRSGLSHKCVVRLSHKYWTQRQVDAFVEIVKTLAKLHSWQIEDAIG